MTERPNYLKSVPPLGTSRREPTTFAVVPQAVALWLLERVGRDALAREAERLEEKGKPGLAAQMTFADEQLSVAAAAAERRREEGGR